MSNAKIICSDFVFMFLPTFAPSGAAIKLAIIMMTAGSHTIWSVMIFPAVEPIDEMNVMASELAIAIFVGIRSTTSIIGIKMNAPAAPTIPAATPTTNAELAAITLLNVTWSSGTSSTFFFGKNIMIVAIVASTA